MIQDFIDGKISIAVTIEDLSYLKVLANMTGLKFRSHDILYGDYMIRLLTMYKTICLKNTETGVCYGTVLSDDVNIPIARLFEPDITIEEDDIMSLIVGD